MRFLAELAGSPHLCAPSIHIAGSKGKGSVTGMLAAMLTAAGFRAARYMSPHVTDIRERITCGNEYFSEEIYCAAGNELRNLADVLLPAASNPLFDESAEDGCPPAYFELLTLLFFLCAKRGKCDIMVVETGMGGRLDSTNILEPLASVITLIELEHVSFLGNTIKKIAEEKAGIIKEGKPLLLAEQCKEALEVFRKTAKEKNSSLFYLPKTAVVSDIKITSQGTNFSLLITEGLGTGDEGQEVFIRENNSNLQSSNLKQQSSVPLNISVPIPGKVYAENAALAITALKTAFPQTGNEAIRSGLKNCILPARFEKISESPPFIIDGAHTPQSLEQCIKTFCSLYGKGGILLFGCAADKDAAAMAEISRARFAKIFITRPGTFKASNPSAVCEAFRAASAGAAEEKTLLIADTQEAVKEAMGFAIREKLPVLGTGSFYLAAEIRKIILQEK